MIRPIACLAGLLALWFCSLLPALGAEVHEAAAAGNLDRVKTLVAASPALVNDRDREGKTPLHYAAAAGQLAMVQFLLDHQADVNARNSTGVTPMYLAKGFGRRDVVDLLGRHGGSLDIVKAPKPVKPVTPPLAPRLPPRAAAVSPAKPALTPLLLVARSNDLATVRRLLTADPQAVAERDAQGWSALHHAAEVGGLEICKALIEFGLSPMVAGEEGLTPLHIACRRGYLEIVRLFLENKGDLRARTSIRASPLLLASASGNPELVRLLLQKGAPVNEPDKYGWTPLLVAASTMPSNPVVALLLDAGADLTAKETATGFTALHQAVAQRDTALVKELLRRQAPLNAMTRDGETPLSLALFEDNREAAALLREAGAKTPPEPTLKPLEQSLVAQYRQHHDKLAKGSFDELRQYLQTQSPTKPEVNKIFLKKAEFAWDMLEKIRRDDTISWGTASRSTEEQEAFLELVRGGAREGEYLRLEPQPPGASVLMAQQKGLINPNLPVLALQIKRRGGQTYTVGDYFLVDQRWVLVGIVPRVFPEISR